MVKYIQHQELGYIMFPGNINHDTMASYLGGKDKVVTAGIVCTSIELMVTRGGSTTLNLPENKEDAEKIQNLFERF